MRKIIYLSLMLSALLFQACAGMNSTQTVDTAEPAVAASETVTATVEVRPTATATKIIIPTALPIKHNFVPSAGTSDRATAHDNENSLSFETKKVKTGDEYYKNRFERPFTSGDMAYLPDLDIVNFSITSDDNFFYVNISMVGLDAESKSLTGFYGIEIDRNADGRAELLLTTHPPYTKEFSADNTAAYLDINSSIGGKIVNRPDDFDSDGFEAIIFDLTQGITPKDDPDLVWVRQDTSGELPFVEIAFEKWIFGDGKESFMWSVLSSDIAIDPTAVYFHDHFTPEQAGAANTDDPNYPLNQLAGVDNTCRVPYGLQAEGREPMGCYVKGGEVEIKSVPSADGPKSTCGQFVDLCARTKNTFVLYSAQ